MPDVINGDMHQRIIVSLDDLPWLPSPSSTVWRKRLHLVGQPESGQVTSLVRYDPHSSFPAHPHPQGEEILVLAGVFSDQYGDWPAGSYLLNPEGFEHAPFSDKGCELFVKLRQYPGTGRQHIAHATDELQWQSSELPGVFIKPLYAESGYPEQMRLERWSPGSSAPSRNYPQGAEILVLKGVLEDQWGQYPALSWLRLPPGAKHALSSAEGCELYIKTGGVAALDSV